MTSSIVFDYKQIARDQKKLPHKENIESSSDSVLSDEMLLSDETIQGAARAMLGTIPTKGKF